MDGGKSSGGRSLKDRLARLLRPANSLLRSPCSSSSSTSTFTTAAAATTTTVSVSTTSSTATAAAFLPSVEPFSAALDLLRHPPRPTEHEKKKNAMRRCCSSSRHYSRSHGHFCGGRKPKLSSNAYGFTTSDDGDDTDGGHDDDDDSEAFFSSRSLMSSDSGFYAYSNSKQHPPAMSRSSRHRRHRQQTRRRRRRAASCVDEACSVREDAVGFRPLLATVAAEEEVRKGLAVVKRSRDPYGDFRESMAEMIVERQVFGAAELERLLRSYMTLNPPRLHPVILQAFSDIWVVLHGGYS